LQIWLKTIL